MERHVRVLLRRVSCACFIIGTLTLFLLFAQPPSYCLRQALTPFPRSSCDSNLRRLPLPPSKLHSSRHWLYRVRHYHSFFRRSLLLQPRLLLSNSTKLLCLSAGAGHQVMALSSLGLHDVTGVEIIDSPPLVQRADPHNLPFFDGSFDLAFSAHLEDALFPDRYAREMERTVRVGGMCVVLVGRPAAGGVRGLFGRSEFVGAWNVTLLGSEKTQIVMRVVKSSPISSHSKRMKMTKSPSPPPPQSPSSPPPPPH